LLTAGTDLHALEGVHLHTLNFENLHLQSYIFCTLHTLKNSFCTSDPLLLSQRNKKRWRNGSEEECGTKEEEEHIAGFLLNPVERVEYENDGYSHVKDKQQNNQG
jgi:hypothetical protein